MRIEREQWPQVRCGNSAKLHKDCFQREGTANRRRILVDILHGGPIEMCLGHHLALCGCSIVQTMNNWHRSVWPIQRYDLAHKAWVKRICHHGNS